MNKILILCRNIDFRLRAIFNGSYISLRAKIVIHKNATITVGKGVRIMQGVILEASQKSTIEFSDGCWIGPGVVIYAERLIKIGINSRIAHYSTIIDHNYEYTANGLDFEKQKKSYPLVIGNNCWVGAGAYMLCGSGLGDNSIVAAGTRLAKLLPENTLVREKIALLEEVINSFNE